jgi:predicted DNA-binding transcriptional regulator YafY
MSNINNLPPTLGMQELADVLRVSVRTIKRYLAERPDALPPGKQIGGRWVWVTRVVFDWLSPPTPPSQDGWGGLLKK